ncbi:hypothetical protein ACWDSJ_06315 [Nocardia sp. NPDC003482]
MFTRAKICAGVVFCVLAVAPFGGVAQAEPSGGSGCGNGDLTWAVDQPINMIPRQVTFTTAGVLRDCVGLDGIGGATVAGVHESVSSCLRPAKGPLTFTIYWSDGETSTVRGEWPVGIVQPTVGELDVIDGLGAGRRVRIVADYNVLTPEMIGGCLGAGVLSGTGKVITVAFV